MSSLFQFCLTLFSTQKGEESALFNLRRRKNFLILRKSQKGAERAFSGHAPPMTLRPPDALTVSLSCHQAQRFPPAVSSRSRQSFLFAVYFAMCALFTPLWCMDILKIKVRSKRIKTALKRKRKNGTAKAGARGLGCFAFWARCRALGAFLVVA